MFRSFFRKLSDRMIAAREQLSMCDECRPLLETIEEHFEADGKANATVEDMLSHTGSNSVAEKAAVSR